MAGANNFNNSNGTGSGSNGATYWSNSAGGSNFDSFYNSCSIASDGTIYVPGGNGNLYALNPNGTTKWTNSAAFSSSANESFNASCTIGSDGTIYQPGANGNLYAINPDGTSKWMNTDAATSGDTFNSNCTVGSDGTIYEPGYWGNLYAFNPNGTLKWANNAGFLNSDSFLAGCSIGSDGTIYIAGNAGYLYAINSDGTLSWANSDYAGTDAFNSSCTIGSNGTLYLAALSGTLYAFHSNGSHSWTNAAAWTNGDTFTSSASVGPGGVLYACGRLGTLYAIGTDGSSLWSNNLGLTNNDRYNSSCSVDADGTIYVPTGNGLVYAFNGSGTLVWTNSTGQTNADSYNSACAIGSGSSLYVASTYGTIYEIGTPGTPTVSSLSLSPSTITGGVTTSTATVTLSWNASPGGQVVNLSHQYPTYVTVPTSVTVPEGSSSATFTISSPQMWAIPFNDLITATSNSSQSTATLTVATTALQSVTVNPVSIGAGSTSTGTVTLGGPAPAGGWTVTLISGSPYFVSVPATVTIPAGASSATFTITSLTSTPTNSYLISAHDSVIWHNANLTVRSCGITNLTVSPTTISAGANTTGTITLNTSAPANGWTVNLSSGVPSEVTVPASVVVPSGATSLTFPITTKATSRSLTIGIYASDALAYKSTTVSVVGNLITGLSVSPTTIGGNGTSTGTITLLLPASTGGWKVNLSAGVPGAVSLPGTVTVPAGASSVTFTISGKESSHTYTTGIYASDGNSYQSTTLTVLGDGIASVSVAPTSVNGGTSATGTVTLTGPAPVGGWLVKLTAGAPGIVGLPTTVLVPAGSSSVNFSVTTKPVQSTLTSLVFATDGSSGASAYLTVLH